MHRRHGFVADEEGLEGGVAVVSVGGGEAAYGTRGLDVAIYPKSAEGRNGDIVVEDGGAVERGDGEARSKERKDKKAE